MTPKEKAKELVERFEPFCAIDISEKPSRKPYAKQCALIAVDEIINALHELMMAQPDSEGKNLDAINYYKEVKEER